MFEIFTNHKKLLIGCGCALLAIILVVFLVVYISNGTGDKPTLPSNGTDGTTQGTAPDGTTNPTDGTTTPTGPDASDPTEPSSGVTDPTVPTIDLTEPTTEPTEPPYTYPTEPNGDVIPIDPNEGTTTTPTVTPVDLGGVTVDTITTEIFNNWSGEQRRAFLEYFNANIDNMTLDQKYHVYQQTQHNGWMNEELMSQGLYFCSERDYERWLEKKDLGCTYCADTDCVAFYARSKKGYTEYDYTKCPHYNEEYDPSIYCQECGLPTGGTSGTKICVRVVKKDQECPVCGDMVYVGKCHECTWP